MEKIFEQLEKSLKKNDFKYEVVKGKKDKAIMMGIDEISAEHKSHGTVMIKCSDDSVMIKVTEIRGLPLSKKEELLETNNLLNLVTPVGYFCSTLCDNQYYVTFVTSFLIDKYNEDLIMNSLSNSIINIREAVNSGYYQ